MTDPSCNAIDWPHELETHKPWLAKVLRCRVGDAHSVDGLLANEEQQLFRSALERLTAAQREILTLKFTENWSYQQLADDLVSAVNQAGEKK